MIQWAKEKRRTGMPVEEWPDESTRKEMRRGERIANLYLVIAIVVMLLMFILALLQI